ncbi:hypothetical protein PTTG_03081 [Puccinia triticina 1-1 BBBD Race 1]|uniref:Uncharacterized protein n=1 Tax=Puccinia triticina (isolate 1-1 / race 1 (BBBD)) TaxID=630390 RepID=A0A180G441_PUCT1|nr:hypothetical protein PTTG_03081 [Puccinia triticina 1-1 BBBD Race 1]
MHSPSPAGLWTRSRSQTCRARLRSCTLVPPSHQTRRLQHASWPWTIPTLIHTKQGLAEVQKHWEKVTPNGTVVLSTVVQRVTWAQFRLDIAVALGKTKLHLGTHIDLMDANGLIKWQGAVKKHTVFGVGQNTVIASNADFDSYVDAILANPNSEVIIRVIMANPRRTAKERKSECAQSDALAIAYGSNDDQLALKRTSA